MHLFAGLRKDGPRKTVPMSPHTKVVHQRNRIAKALIWAAALVTLGVLTLILGYILVNGFYTRETRELPVLPYTNDDSQIAVLVSRSIHLRNIDFDTLREIYIGATDNWGFISGQDRKISVYLLDDSEAFVDAVDDYLLGKPSAPAESGVQMVRSAETVEERLRQERGAIAIVPASVADAIRSTKRLGVRDMSVVVNPNVTELVDGARIRAVTEGNLEQLLSGEMRTWGEVRAARSFSDGETNATNDRDPVRVIALDGTTIETGSGRLPASQAVSRTVESVAEFAEAVSTTPGAIGLLPRRHSLNQNLAVLDVRFVTHSANLRPSFFWEKPSRAGEVGGISTIIINTLVMIAFVLMIATPIGVAAAVYLVEYAKQGKLLILLRVGTDTLAGVPSIIFGLFGLVFFSQFLGLQTGLLSGSLTLTMMILPTVVRAGEEALRSVPDSLREASLA
jgi:phosphate transport system permease protein